MDSVHIVEQLRGGNPIILLFKLFSYSMCISKVAVHTWAVPALWTYISDTLARYMVHTKVNMYYYYIFFFFFF